MTLAPCVRLTDVVIKKELKNAVPGPGAYNLRTYLESSAHRKTGNPSFGCSIASRFSKPADGTPAPGAYHIEPHTPKVCVYSPTIVDNSQEKAFPIVHIAF